MTTTDFDPAAAPPRWRDPIAVAFEAHRWVLLLRLRRYATARR